MYVWFQTTGRLKIGTYTGPLQHGIVYSGGKTSFPFSCSFFDTVLHFWSGCDYFMIISFRFVRHCVRLAGGQRERHSVYWWPYFWRHPEVQETSRLEDIPGYTWAGAGAARVDGQELWDKRTTHRDTWETCWNISLTRCTFVSKGSSQ